MWNPNIVFKKSRNDVVNVKNKIIQCDIFYSESLKGTHFDMNKNVNRH